MKPLQLLFVAIPAFCLLLTGPDWQSATANGELNPSPEALLAEVRALALAAKLQLSFDQITSLQEFAQKASAAAVEGEKENAESWNGVGNDVWTAIEQTLKARTVSPRTWAKIEREVASNRTRLDPLLTTIGEALADAADVLSEEQKKILGMEVEETSEQLRPTLSVTPEQFQQLVGGVLSARSLTPQDFASSRQGLALSLAEKIVPAAPDATTLAQRILAVLDAVYGLSDEQFEAEKDKLADDIGRYLGVQVRKPRRELRSDELDEGDWADFLTSPEGPRILKALLQGQTEAGAGGEPAPDEGRKPGAEVPPSEAGQAPAAPVEGEAATQASDSWQWERALFALDCLRLVTTLSLSQEQMRAMAPLIHNFFEGKLPEDWERLLASKTDQLAKTREQFWAVYLSQPPQELVQQAETMVVSLRRPTVGPEAAKATLGQLKRLLLPEQAALIDWGDSSLFPKFIPGPPAAALAQQQYILNYIHQRLAQARFMPARSRKGRLPPHYSATRWRFTLADDILRDLSLFRPISPQQYPALLAAVQDAMFAAIPMTPEEFATNGYQLAVSLMQRLGLGLPPPQPPPPPPPILESEFDRIMLDPGSEQVLVLGAAGQ